MSELPELTILLGPQTRVSLALNAHFRENRQYLYGKGMTVLPSRLASPIVRRALDDRPEDERFEEFDDKTRPRPAVLSAINVFGPPEAGLAKGELFPDVEVRLAGLAPFIGKARIVLAIDTLPAFFLAAQSAPLEERVRRTPWEVLYELSWYELLAELVELLPHADFVVVTGRSDDLEKLAEMFIGTHGAELPAPHALLRQLISETGHAVLARMLERGQPDAAMLADLYRSFALQPTKQDLRDRLGMDKVTGILLDQRFEEDLQKISTLPRVEMV